MPFATPLGRNLMLVFVIGRKTGKTYRQPLSYVRDGATLLTPGGGRWKLNLTGDTPVRIRLRGHDIRAIPELVSDAAEVDRLLHVMVAASRRAAAFTGIARTPDGGFDRAGLEKAIRYGFRVVRWHPLAAAELD